MFMNVNPKLAGTLILMFGLSGSVNAEPNKPNYEFDAFEEVRSVSNSSVSGWAPINDQVLIMSTGPNRKYLVVLSRPDHHLVYSFKLAVTHTGGEIMAKFDKVYPQEEGIKLGIPIKAIYKLDSKEQVALAHQLIEEIDKNSK